MRGLRAVLVAAILLGALPAAGTDYSVDYNPYASVDWANTLRCQSQHHDHVHNAAKVLAMDAAGYCAVMFMTYSGTYRPSTMAEWLALGSPNPDPGKPNSSWVGYRRWPATSHGAPAVPLTNLKFYIPGAEEIALMPAGFFSAHLTSVFLETYIEGWGCDACGPTGIPSAQNNDGLPDSRRWATNQQGIDAIVNNGGHATINHWGGGPSQYPTLQALENFGSMEMFNNYYRMWDDKRNNNVLSDQIMAAWDYALTNMSSQIWGVSVNDWFSAWSALGNPGDPVNFPDVTLQNRDRGKLQVLLPSYDLAAYRQSFEAGAFFAIVEDNATKAAYPTVTDILVTPSSISIQTAAGTETVSWIANGSPLATGSTLSLDALPADLKYVRATISDGQGRIVYSQPFTLGDRFTPVLTPVPALSRPGLALLGALLLGVSALVSRRGRIRV